MTQSAGAVYNHKGKEKKKLKLVDKVITPSELVLLLKEKLNKFPVQRKKIKTTKVFCETSHGKSKSDGLGGVIKSITSCAVCGE